MSLPLFYRGWQKMWESWVRDKGLYYSQHSKRHEHEHVYISSPCASPWGLMVTMRRSPKGADMHSRVRQGRGTLGLVNRLFYSKNLASLLFRPGGRYYLIPPGCWLQTHPWEMAQVNSCQNLYILHIPIYWIEWCPAPAKKKKDISVSLSPKSITITLFG